MKRRLLLQAIRDALVLAHAVAVVDVSQAAKRSDAKTVTGQTELKLFLAGDVMTGRGIDQILPYSCAPDLYEPYVKDARQYVSLAESKNGSIRQPVDFAYIWGDALNVWQSERPDLRIVNLETSVTTSDAHWPGKGIHYRMHPANVPCLTAAGIDCCILANNHVMDWGRAGLAETLTALGSAGLTAVGAGRSLDEAARPARFAISGKGDVLVFAYAAASSGVPESWGADPGRSGVHLLADLSARSAANIAAEITAIRRPGDVVVASIHWGGNWGYDVPAEQRSFAHILVDHGNVDVVHGHSSHHAKSVEIYNGKLIIYGCGDLVTDYEGIGGHQQFRPWIAPMYFVTIAAQTRRIRRLEVIPLCMRRLRLSAASPDDRSWFGATMNEISRGLATEFDVRADRLVASLPPHLVMR